LGVTRKKKKRNDKSLRQECKQRILDGGTAVLKTRPEGRGERTLGVVLRHSVGKTMSQKGK